MPWTFDQLQQMPRDEFVRIIGPAFEHSSWIAERAAAQRPFASVEALHSALCRVVAEASLEEQLALIRAHPDLVGNAVLTAESRGEQAAAGLGNLSPEEAAQFAEFNRAYRERFGFPLVICARQNRKEAILAAFPRRLGHDAATERAAALEQIFMIARLRLLDLLA